jgi:hypothetical protein
LKDKWKYTLNGKQKNLLSRELQELLAREIGKFSESKN